MADPHLSLFTNQRSLAIDYSPIPPLFLTFKSSRQSFSAYENRQISYHSERKVEFIIEVQIDTQMIESLTESAHWKFISIVYVFPINEMCVLGGAVV